jgi:hypothetical protein
LSKKAGTRSLLLVVGRPSVAAFIVGERCICHR